MNKIIGIIVVLLILGYPIAYYLSAEDIVIKVVKTERIVESSGSGENLRTSSKYLVYTSDEVFENTDSWLYWKFSSSDIYVKLNNGRTYKVKVAGWRIPFFSWYRNIVRIR